MEFRLQKRQQDFINNTEDFSTIKENSMSNELSLGENSINLIFKQRRLKQNLPSIETIYSLKEKISIPQEWYEKCEKSIFDISNFSKILSAFKSNNDIQKKFFGLIGIKKLILLPESPVQELLNEGITQELIILLELNSNPEFQFESLLCLTYLITKINKEVKYIILKQAIKKLYKIFDSKIEEIKSQAALFSGNLANESSQIRDLLINEKIYDKILTIIASTNQKKLIKNCFWAIGNFFRIKPIMPYDIAKKCIKIIARNLFFLQDDKEFLYDACFILCFITENYKEGIKELMELEILENIIKLLDCNIPYIQITSLRLIGNIASGNANQTQKLIDLGLLSQLKKTIFNPKKSIRKETAWILSNIAAGTQKQVENLITEDFLLIFQKIIEFDEPDVMKECIWAMANLTNVKNPILMKKILEQGILLTMNNCLMFDDAKNLAVNLEALGNLLFFGKNNKIDGVNPVVKEMERIGMVDLLEKLQTHPFEVVYEKSLKLINRGHTLKCFDECVKKLRDNNIEVVVHIINGIPYETKEMMLETIKHLNDININGIKIHMLYISKGTELEELYLKEKFHVLTKEEYIDIVISQLELLNPKIVIHRITGDPVKEDLIEPTWLLKKFCVLNDIDKEMVKKNSYQGKSYIAS